MNPATFLALGDSYTIGEGVEADERWPAQLARRLGALGVAVAEPLVVARTGWTTDELSAAMDAMTLAPPYDLVTLLIGVNNQYRDRPLANYRDEFAALLGRACGLSRTGARGVVVVSIPDWGVTRFAASRDAQAIALAIDAFNRAAQDITAAAGAAFVDVTAASREAGDAAAMLVGDGLHPSAAQYALWTDEILPAAHHALLSGKAAAAEQAPL
ncbi:SGNH/GDSL hydrolase family protein [Dokdonella sp.]|uniref:SGNH/GDSL hydrolase family protein n=1 Tax=Dokdonella sp. TaxID=2291710 RepID=UPI003782E785